MTCQHAFIEQEGSPRVQRADLAAYIPMSRTRHAFCSLFVNLYERVHNCDHRVASSFLLTKTTSLVQEYSVSTAFSSEGCCLSKVGSVPGLSGSPADYAPLSPSPSLVLGPWSSRKKGKKRKETGLGFERREAMQATGAED